MQPNEAPHAYQAIQKALELAAEHANPNERRFIEAMEIRYRGGLRPGQEGGTGSCIRGSHAAVAEQFPGDLDAATLYAEALFLLEPRRGTRDLNDPDVQRLHGVLEGILEQDIRHTGACHLYIHATESTVQPVKPKPAPHIGLHTGASHINHMPSHNLE